MEESFGCCSDFEKCIQFEVLNAIENGVRKSGRDGMMMLWILILQP